MYTRRPITIITATVQSAMCINLTPEASSIESTTTTITAVEPKSGCNSKRTAANATMENGLMIPFTNEESFCS